MGQHKGVVEMVGMELTDFGVRQEAAERRAQAALEADFNDFKKDAGDSKAESNFTGLAACRTRGERRGRKNKGKIDLTRGVKTNPNSFGAKSWANAGPAPRARPRAFVGD